MHVTYRPGSKNGKADALSRKGSKEEMTDRGHILSRTCFLTQVPSLWDVIKQNTPILEGAPKDVILTSKDGYLFYQHRVYVPPASMVPVLQHCHDSPLGGHSGVRKTLDLLTRYFWWPQMTKTVTDYVLNCPVCIRMKNSTRMPQGLLHPLPVPEAPWREISIDFIVELPVSKGCNTIMVVVDRFTKMAHFIPVGSLPTAAETATLFVNNIFRLHGLPTSVLTDRGTQFTSRFWAAFCRSLHMDKALTSAYHPQANGQTERVNGVLEQYLRCYLSHLQDNWVDYLSLAEFAYNNQVHRSTHMTPFYINNGYHPVMLPGSPVEINVPGVEERLASIHRNYGLVRAELMKAQRAYKHYADLHRTAAPSYKEGDRAWLSTRHIKLNCPSRKLGPRFVGPFPVVKVISPVAVKLGLPPSLRIHPVFHVSLLRPSSEDPFKERTLTTPGPVSCMSDDEEYEVEEILDSRIQRRRLEYLVRWVGYGPEDDAWISVDEVHAPTLIRQFHAAHPDHPRRGRIGGGLCQDARPTDRIRRRSRRLPAGHTTIARGRACSVHRSRPCQEQGRQTSNDDLTGRQGTGRRLS